MPSIECGHNLKMWHVSVVHSCLYYEFEQNTQHTTHTHTHTQERTHKLIHTVVEYYLKNVCCETIPPRQMFQHDACSRFQLSTVVVTPSTHSSFLYSFFFQFLLDFVSPLSMLTWRQIVYSKDGENSILKRSTFLQCASNTQLNPFSFRTIETVLVAAMRLIANNHIILIPFFFNVWDCVHE